MIQVPYLPQGIEPIISIWPPAAACIYGSIVYAPDRVITSKSKISGCLRPKELRPLSMYEYISSLAANPTFV